MAFGEEIINNEGGENGVSPQDFVSSLNNGQENAPIEIPDKIGELATGDFLKAYAQATGVENASYEDFQNTLRYKEQVETLRQQNGQLKAKTELNPYHNDLSKGVNDLFSKGATAQEAVSYLKMQSLNVSELSPKEAIILAEQLQMTGRNTNISQADWDNWYEQKYGSPLDEDGKAIEMTGLQKIELDRQVQAAKSTLEQLKVEKSKPDSVVQKERAEARFNGDFQWWGAVVTDSIMNTDKKTFSVTLGKDANGKDQTASYDFPLSPDTRQAIVAESAKWAASQGLGKTREDLAKVEQYAERMIWGAFGPQIMQNFANSLKSSTTQDILGKQHNVKPLHELQKQVPIVTPTDEAAMIAKIKGNAKPFG
jgi:hypothetical protein